MCTVGRWTIVPAPPTSPCSFQRSTRATGRVPFGRPYCSTRTLTVDRGGKGPSPTTLYGGDAGRKLLVPCSHHGWWRYAYKGFNRRIFWFSYALPTQERGPGFCSGPACRRSGPKLHPKPILTDLGDRQKTHDTVPAVVMKDTALRSMAGLQHFRSSCTFNFILLLTTRFDSIAKVLTSLSKFF